MTLIISLVLAFAAVFAPTLPPCATDETPEAGMPACYWDAANRGNGQGGSFIWTGSHSVTLPR